jgi:hypothetical protein
MTATRRLPAQRKARSGHDTMARQRGIRALELRTQGWTLDQIAQELGYSSKSGPSEAIDRELNRWSDSAATTHRAVMARQLDGLIRDAYEQRELCKAPIDRLWFTDRIRGLLSDKSKLLGLALGADEIAARTPYVKRIILMDRRADALPGPGEDLQLPPGDTIDAGA